MKMLKTWFCILVLGLVFPVIVSAQATSKNIQVRADHDYPQNRSLLPKIPVLASFDGTSLYSVFVQTIGEVTIIVTDQSGKIVVQKSLLSNGEQKDVISLSDLPKATYKVSYLLGERCFYGMFDL